MHSIVLVFSCSPWNSLMSFRSRFKSRVCWEKTGNPWTWSYRSFWRVLRAVAPSIPKTLMSFGGLESMSTEAATGFLWPGGGGGRGGCEGESTIVFKSVWSSFSPAGVPWLYRRLLITGSWHVSLITTQPWSQCHTFFNLTWDALMVRVSIGQATVHDLCVTKESSNLLQ